MSVLRVLRIARARYAESPSHAPYGSGVEPGRHCVCTALDSALDTNGVGHYLLGRAAGLPLADPRTELIRWNAEHSTEEVLTAFDLAIATAEAEAS